MSTSFYWRVPGYPFELPTGETWFPGRDDPMVHLGKRVGVGSGRVRFTWAQKPDDVLAVIEKYPGRELVEDEYGRLYTGEEFMIEIGEPEDWNIANVGVWFS